MQTNHHNEYSDLILTVTTKIMTIKKVLKPMKWNLRSKMQIDMKEAIQIWMSAHKSQERSSIQNIFQQIKFVCFNRPLK